VLMIELKNIYHSYGSEAVLTDLSLQLEAQKIHCLLGSSGSGKTTILRLIAGLEVPQKGMVSNGGITLTGDAEILIPADRRKIGFVFQDLALWPHLSVYKNIAFGLEEQKADRIKEKVFEILHHFDLEEFAGKYPHQLSGGQQQLVAIARSLVLKPDVLLMDEPLANLDVKLKRKMLAHIKKLKQDFNLTMIYVTHDHREAFSIADRVIVLNDGRIEAMGSLDEIKKSENEFVKYFLEY